MVKAILLCAFGAACGALIAVEWTQARERSARLSRESAAALAEPDGWLKAPDLITDDPPSNAAMQEPSGDRQAFQRPDPPLMNRDLGLDDDDSSAPTLDGLYARTAGWWDDEEFLALTGDEMSKLAPEVAGAYSGWTKPLSEILTLPTREDCERAYADPVVRLVLARACAVELALNDLGMMTHQNAGRAQLQERAKELLRETKEKAELELMSELERTTHYAHWTLLYRVHSAWMK